ncbi:SAM-dependent methyltransferase [Nonomuraea guangzhouensis]|uniref:SAM-dependent methyltransferase n=1 Tax=Nonomuraea guangzhouensis TaxID=1291555 RepID=A0ABW4GLW3_9ACTN|nr:SAM-dependent methyltransferase [Nonomuraea guangzhouensis]
MTKEIEHRIDTSVPHPARVYDYWLGGKDNFEADRVVAEMVLKTEPGMIEAVRENRAFLGRVVRYLAEAGISQFLDIGTGIPTQGNTHEVAQSVNPAARIVYVDNDPIVMNHARALLRGSEEGRTTYIEADLLEPETILGDRSVRDTLDFGKPIAVIIIGTLMHIRNELDPWSAVKAFSAAVCPGSFLALSHTTADFEPEAMAAMAEIYRDTPTGMTHRSGPEIARFFDGYALVEPGLVVGHQWRPEGGVPKKVFAGGYGVVGRKL